MCSSGEGGTDGKDLLSVAPPMIVGVAVVLWQLLEYCWLFYCTCCYSCALTCLELPVGHNVKDWVHTQIMTGLHKQSIQHAKHALHTNMYIYRLGFHTYLPFQLLQNISVVGEELHRTLTHVNHHMCTNSDDVIGYTTHKHSHTWLLDMWTND